MSNLPLPRGWRTVELGEISLPKQWPTISQENLAPQGYKVYGANGVIGYYHKFTHKDVAVAITCRGSTCGEINLTEPMSYITGNAMALDNLDNKSTTPQYIAYFLKRDGLRACITGSAQPQIIGSALKNVSITLPPLPEQVAICGILNTLDTTIRKTEAIIEKLKQIKQGLLRDLLTRGIAANGELRPPYEQAPHLYKESPLGWIPKEWEVVPLENCVSSLITYGIVQAGPHIEDGIPYIRTGDMAGNRLDRSQMLCTSYRIAQAFQRSEVRTGEIVCAIRATVGKVLEVPPELDGANLTQGTARIAPKSEINNKYLLWAIRSEAVVQEIQLEIKGTTFAEITLAKLREISIPLPRHKQEQDKIASQMESCEHRIYEESTHLNKLRMQKSALMDDLLTGRVRVTPLLQQDKPHD